MICLLKDWLRRAHRPAIRLSRPSHLIIVSGATREAIDAIFDASNRMTHLIIHTRHKNLR